MAWSTGSIQRERRRRRSGAITTDGRGVPITNQLRVKPATRTRYSDGSDNDVRIGIRLSDGSSIMSLETVNERAARIERERREIHNNLLFEKADRLRRMRELVAKQGNLDLPDHW